MSTLLRPRVRPSEEAVHDAPARSREVVADSPVREDVPRRRASQVWPPPPRHDLIEAAHQVAKDLYACWDLSERIEVYKEVGARFKSDARRVLNIAVARWPEMIEMVNDLPEWKALLSADVS
ncbi:MAG TPA: hypothetical protein VEP91_06760 [Solirubrobacterales bacterium]|nr:hypothetical protein [Solirubrobacterales bacterium]